MFCASTCRRDAGPDGAARGDGTAAGGGREVKRTVRGVEKGETWGLRKMGMQVGEEMNQQVEGEHQDKYGIVVCEERLSQEAGCRWVRRNNRKREGIRIDI